MNERELVTILSHLSDILRSVKICVQCYHGNVIEGNTILVYL